MSARKIFIRYAVAADIERLLREGVVSGPPPPRESWAQRLVKWLAEQRAGRRAVLVAEDPSGLLGMVHLVFKFPVGYEDAEAANGMDVAMMEGLRTRADAPAEVGNQLVEEAQRIAVKRNVKTLTFCLPMNQARGIRQAKLWGFQEFRIMAEPAKMLAFFRKSIE
ncbi:MAG: GNAT family N-acetyltransferase [Vulcanimicrobiaceae bacterium]